MAASKITYDDKVGIVPRETHINQVWDADMNEIKLKHNDNADLIDVIEQETDVNTLDIIDVKSDISSIEALTLDEKGWAHYVDDISTEQTITSTPSKMTINKLGITNNNDYLPREIRGVGELWDSVENKITPISLGDSYDLRIDVEVLSTSANPNELTLTLDIGGTSSITIPILTRFISLSKTPPYIVSVGFPIFCLSNFLTNGGQLFLNTDTGTVNIGLRNILIKRDYKGDL